VLGSTEQPSAGIAKRRQVLAPEHLPVAGLKSQQAFEVGLPKVKQTIRILGDHIQENNASNDKKNESRERRRVKDYGLPNLTNVKTGGLPEINDHPYQQPFMKQNLSSNQLANPHSKTDLQAQHLITTPGKRKHDPFAYGEPVQMENMRKAKNEDTVSLASLPNYLSGSCNRRRESAKTRHRLHLSSTLRRTQSKRQKPTAQR
jgi:hypothetical protein